MAGKLPMGQKELLRGKLTGMVKQGEMTLKTAAGQLKTSYWQGIRLYRAYRTGVMRDCSTVQGGNRRTGKRRRRSAAG
jgi:hypothetical protein